MIRPQALFLDIDGTILKSDHTLSPRVSAAVTRIRESGTLAVLATGRSWESLKPLYDKLGLDGPTICYNGAFIVEGPEGRRVFEVDVDEEVARYAIDISRRTNIELTSYRHSRMVYERCGEEIRIYKDRVGLPGQSVNFDDIDSLELTKLIFISRKGDLDSVQEELKKAFPPERLTVTYSDPIYLEVMAGGVDKGRGLREVCRMHDIEVSASAAMGDGWNDLALLEAAGDAWVMGGAPDGLKARFPSNRIAPSSDHEGAAKVMEAMMEEREPDFSLEEAR